MSVLFNALDKLDEKKAPSAMPWKSMSGSGPLAVDLPSEMWNDFYDLREYIRIANMRGMMRLLSITSSVSGEGSSTVAAYLALLMAGANKKAKETVARIVKAQKNEATAKDAAAEKLFEEDFRAFVHESVNDKKKNGESAAAPSENVLLIDGNLHKPGIHEILGLPLEQGLNDILEQNIDWHRCVKTIKGAQLSVITAGKSKLNPAELFGADYFRYFIKAVKEEYSYVLIDAPAVLNYVESMSIAAVVDGVVLVVRAGQTRWEIAQDAKRKLITAHANLLGVALNRRK